MLKTALEDKYIATIVAGYASRQDVNIDDIVDLVARLRTQADYHVAGTVTDNAAEGQSTLSPALPVEKAFTQSKVFCLCCGRGFKMLKRHLGAEHGMTEAEYRSAFDLPESVPLVAPDYSERKAAYARQAGLGTHAREASGSEKTLS